MRATITTAAIIMIITQRTKTRNQSPRTPLPVTKPNWTLSRSTRYMMSVIQLLRRCGWVSAWVLAALTFSGCQSDPVYTDLPEPGATGSAAIPANPDNSDRLQVGDVLSIVLSDLPGGPATFDQPIPEAGTITLLLNQHFSVVGVSLSALEQEIRAADVPKY